MKCPNCGKEIANDSKFCEFCGAKIIFASIGEKSPQKKKVVWITLILILCLLLFGGILYYEHAREETERKASLAAQGFVDLGLPSGTLWKNRNEKGTYTIDLALTKVTAEELKKTNNQYSYEGFFTYEEAVTIYSSNLPTKEQYDELISDCKWQWTRNGYEVTGPNGAKIFFPAAGNRPSYCLFDMGVSTYGIYWSSSWSESTPWSLQFASDHVFMVDTKGEEGGSSVRLVHM